MNRSSHVTRQVAGHVARAMRCFLLALLGQAWPVGSKLGRAYALQ